MPEPGLHGARLAAFDAGHPLKVGTRQSPLALAQAHEVADALCRRYAWPDDAVQLVPMIASGDRILDRPLHEVGGKALWTKELDRALADGDIDIAVHSMKDVETARPPAFEIAATLERADVRDRLIGRESIAALPSAARVGTASPRRTAQLLAIRPDLQPLLFRGNVATRLAKLAAGEADATLLAAAGLDRLGLHDTGVPVPVEIMLPAPAQGAIGIELLAVRHDLGALIAGIGHRPTFDCVMAERAFLYALGADCRSPVAALAVNDRDNRGHGHGPLTLTGELLMPDGTEHVRGTIAVDAGAMTAPALLARQLLDRASPRLRALFAA